MKVDITSNYSTQVRLTTCPLAALCPASVMPTITTIERVDGELRVAVSEKMLKHRNLEEGDRVHVIESSDGILIVPFDEDFEEAMALYDRGKAAYDNVLDHLSD